MLNIRFGSGGGKSFGGKNLNRWTRETTTKNNSCRAITSPGHDLLPKRYRYRYGVKERQH